jgi:hypothetical protein
MKRSAISPAFIESCVAATGELMTHLSALDTAPARATRHRRLIRAERLADVSRLSISAKQVHETQLKHG